MRRLSLANLRANPGRFASTALAVVVATAFLAGVLTLRDSVGQALRDSAETGLEGVDVAVVDLGDDLLADIEAPRLTPDVLEDVRAVPDVAGADGRLTGELALLADGGDVRRGGIVGSRRLDPPTLGPYAAVGGRLPAAAGEVAVDEAMAEDEGLVVGDQVALATTDGRQDATVVGVVRWGDRSSSGDGGDVVVAAADAEAWLGASRSGFDAVLAQAAPGTEPDAVAADVADALADRPGITVLSGDEYRALEAGAAASLADLLGTGLQVFAYVALLVGAFIIANTFTITVAQRVRELALLRAVGATGRQIRSAVRTEALVLGLVASALGWAAGVVGYLLAVRAVPGLSSLAGGDAGLVVRPTSMAQVLISGTVVTVAAALVPAFKASRVAPLQALRDVSVDRTGAQVLRALAGVGLLVVGLAALAATAVGIGPSLLGLVGPVALLLGVVVGGPWLAGRTGHLLAAPIDAERHPVAALAVGNVRRNPRRTASTASALLIGVFLVVFVTSAGGAVRDWIVAQLSTTASADLTVVSFDGVLPPGVEDLVAGTAGVVQVAPVEAGVATADLGGDVPVSAGDLPLVVEVTNLDLVAGSFEDLDERALVLPELVARAGGIDVGDEVVLTFAGGDQRTVVARALVGFSFASLSPLISADVVVDVEGELVPSQLEVAAADGRIAEVRGELEAGLAAWSSVGVVEGSEIGALVADLFNGLIQSVNALLAVAVLIALFGIVNTLVLSITERTRELGLLRAVGTTRRQLRAAVRIEAVVVAGLGTVLGVVTGLLCGFVITIPVLADGEVEASFSWPLRQVAVVLVLGLVLGVVASVLPARRVGRLEVIEALRDE